MVAFLSQKHGLTIILASTCIVIFLTFHSDKLSMHKFHELPESHVDTNVDIMSNDSDEYEGDKNDYGDRENNDFVPDEQQEHGENEDRKHEPSPNSNTKKFNVLFVMTDDMRAQMGAYAGPLSEYSKHLLTPNLDKFAQRSLVLKNAHVQYTLCGPSRVSMLTSRRPDTTKVDHNKAFWRDVGGNFTTLPQYFKEQGYDVIGMGKIYHTFVDPLSWSSDFISPNTTLENEYWPLENGGAWRGVKSDEDTANLPDQILLNHAKEYLTKLAANAQSENQPFFLGFGFTKPHLNFVCPKKFFDKYPLENEDQFLSKVEWQEPRVKYGCGVINTTKSNDSSESLPHETLRQFRQAYFGCVSYVDSLFGELIKTVDDLGLKNSTIISFVADHGYHLGENGEFGKQTLYRPSTHVPMMVHIPGRTESGISSNSPVEGLDLFPTIVEAAGLDNVQRCPHNSSSVDLCVQGRSLLPLIDNPLAEIKQGAISQLRNIEGYGPYSLITSRYRYTKCLQYINETVIVKDRHDRICTEELYDQLYDSEEAENLASLSKYASIKKTLDKTLMDIVVNQ